VALRQDPSDVLDYTVDWSNVLVGGETISTSSWTAPGLTITGEVSGTTTVTAFLAGGTDGTQYVVTNQITTSASRTYNRQFTLTVQNL
jgi:hypothetical protein